MKRLVNELIVYGYLQNASWGVDMALLSEAHGLVTDLLLESATMPPHLASGLKVIHAFDYIHAYQTVMMDFDHQ